VQMQCITLKQAGEMLDLNRVAVGLAHPGMLRRLGFAIRELEDRMPSECRSGSYSSSIELPEEIQQAETLDVYVPTATAHMRQEQQVEWIIGQLVKQGVKLTRSVGR
jgi:hypothetical protein